MVQSKWKGTLVVTAAWAGLAWGQQPQPTAAPVSAGERVITVQQAGKSDQSCRVMTSKTMPDGSVVMELQNTATGEHLTVAEPKSASKTENKMEKPKVGFFSRLFSAGEGGEPVNQNETSSSPTVAPLSSWFASSKQETVHSQPQPRFRAEPIQHEVKKVEHSRKVQDPLQTPEKFSSRSQEGWTPAETSHTPKIQSVSQVKVVSQATSDVPSGMHSVMAAGSSPGTICYVPVPLVTVPDVTRPPQPPPGPWGQPSGYVGAPAGVGLPSVGALPASPGVLNAFTPRPQPYTPPPGQVAEGNAFTAPTFVPPQAQMARMTPPSYPAAPMQEVITQASYTAPVSDEGENLVPVLQLLLTNSLYPSDRELAADKLAKLSEANKVQVLPLLLKAAHDDPAPTVRAACIRNAVSLNVGDRATVAAALEQLRSDSDAHVQTAITAALDQLKTRR